MYLNGKEVPTVDIQTALDDFLAWIEKFQDVVLCAHNVKRFDLPLLVSVLGNVNKLDRFNNCVRAVFDSLPVFRKVHPGRSYYKQDI